MDLRIETQLAEFAVGTRYVNIPEDVVEFAKSLALKTVAGMVAGAAKPAGRKFARLIRDRRLNEEVGVIGGGFKTSLWEAVQLHQFFAHASELEDDKFGEGFSWDITVIPLLFPLAEKLRLSGKALIEAIVVGLEVDARIGLFPSDRSGVKVISHTGAVGPAVGAAKGLCLGIKETISALGLAMSGPPTLLQAFGTDAHYFQSSLYSLQGIMAAELAKEGMTAYADIAEFLCDLLGKERVVPAKIVEGLGKEWLFRQIGIKKYPCCFYTQRAIDAALELRKEHNLSYEQVDTIEVHGGLGDEIVNRPEPKTLGDLQFSLQHLVGTAMLDGDVNEDHTTDDAVVEPRLKEARSKVKVVIHADWPPAPMTAPSRVVIKTLDGREFSRERMHEIGSPEEPLSREQFRELYVKFTGGILPPDQIDRTADAILNLEKLNDVEELMDILTFRHRIPRI